MATSKEDTNNSWSWEQNKAFETGLAIFAENCEQRWEKIAEQIPGHKTIEQVKHHYQLLLDDIANIEAGNVDLPIYSDESSSSKKKVGISRMKSDWERRRGQAWSEEEHKQFLLGMEKYGKGDWKTIAKEFVRTRTPTQVASHAQKHFKRQEKKKKDVKRWSIFDITSPTGNDNDPATLPINGRIYSIGNGNGSVARPVSPPLSPPFSWCLDSDDDGLDLAYEECLSQLPPL